MGKLVIFWLLLSFGFSVLADSSVRSDERPKIGLALGGGGAKGAAHIGVIRVLEELNIPVDYVAGTSMGAYVAGMYAMGLSADEIEQRMLSIDWNQGYSDSIDRKDLSYRKKKQRDGYQIEADIGFDGREFKLPSGFVQGETMARLLRQSTRNLPNFQSFDQMPIPYRAVTLDLEKMEAFVLDKGNLVTAMQASMSVPGALKPAQVEGRLLADGGLVNNLPVDVLKEMGADIVIAVDIGSKLRKKEELDSYVNILDQLTNYMTRSSTERQIALMSEQDILLAPDIADIGTGDFSRMADAVPRGSEVANAIRERLSQLSISGQDYKNYLVHKATIRAGYPAGDGFIADKVEIVTDSKLNKNIIEAALGVEEGELYSQHELEENIHRLYAKGIYQRVDYEFEDKDGKTLLKVYAKEKSWGPGYFDFMLATEESFSSSTDITVGFSYTLTDINSLGAEWRNEFVFGTRTYLGTEFYTPLDEQQFFFWQAEAAFSRQNRNFYIQPESKSGGAANSEFAPAQYTTYLLGTELGINPSKWSQASLGWETVSGDIELVGANSSGDFRAQGPYAKFGYDTLDDINFPNQGHQLEFKYQKVYEKTDSAREDSDYIDAKFLTFESIGRHSFGLNLEYGGISSDLGIPTLVHDLGGFQRLSGYHKNEVSGRYKIFGSLLYNYRMLDNDFGAFSLPMYFGASLENGNVWNNRSEVSINNTITAGSIYLGVNTGIGPMVLAYGQAEGGKQAVYLFIGNYF